MTPKGSRPVLRGLVGSNAHPATQLIDFLAVLFGYEILGERTLEADLTRGCSRSPSLSWRCLTVIDCQLARPSHVFWQR